MDERNRTVLWVGLGLIGFGILIGALTPVTGSGFVPLGGGTFVFFGLVILVVAALRGRGHQQQQQQQVVVITPEPGPAPGQPAGGARVRCPSCGHLNAGAAGFCGECGTTLGRRPPKRA